MGEERHHVVRAPSGFAAGQARRGFELLELLPQLVAALLAREALAGRNRAVVVPGMIYPFATFLTRLSPRFLNRMILAWVQK